jgi:MFS family permease
MAFVAEAVPKERTGSAMGLLGTMSAIGTAMGPSLGGLLIAGLGWRSLFYINLPLGVLAFVLACFYLPEDRQTANAHRKRFDVTGTVLLALTLAAYALAVTLGHGSFGLVNLGLLLMAFSIGGVFLAAQSKAESPLIPLEIFRQSTLRAGFIMSALVTTVVMATLVVGPFYLSGALLLDTTHVGLVMSCGPIIAALTGVPAGRLVDRFVAHRMAIAGLVGMAIGTCILPMLPTSFGVPGYIAPLVVITAGYALFQAANNTSVMTHISADQRGVVSGMLNLSRNLGLVTGASVMGAIFALGSSKNDVINAGPDAIATGMRITFAAAAILVFVALAVAATSNGQRNTSEA